jgi:hypothetical protein
LRVVPVFFALAGASLSTPLWVPVAADDEAVLRYVLPAWAEAAEDMVDWLIGERRNKDTLTLTPFITNTLGGAYL